MHTEPPFASERRELPGPGEREPGTRRQGVLTFAGPARRLPEPLPPQEMPPAAGIDVGALLRALRRRLPIIIAMTMLGAGLGIAAQSAIKPRYTSAVSLLLEPKRADATGGDTLFGSIMVDSSKIASVVSVIESSDLLRRVVTTEHLDQVPEFGDAGEMLPHKWLAMLPFLKPPVISNDPEERQNRALDRLERAVRVERVGFTYVLTIEVKAAHPDIARRVAGAVADAYLSDQVERKTAATQRDDQWLAQRLTDVRRDLRQSEEALDAVREKYGLLETDGGNGTTMDRQALTALNAQLTQARAEVATLRARYEQVEHARATGGLEGLPEVAGSAAIEALRAKQTEATQQLAALRAVYGENYPDVRRLEDGQRTLQGQLAAEVSRLVEGRRNEYETAVARERALSEQVQRAVTNDGGAVGSQGHEQLRDAQRMVDANRGLYDSLINRWREVQQQQTREEPEGRIISQASLPDAPSFPKPLMLPAGGAAVLLFASLGLALVPTLLDKRFVSVTAVEQRLGLPVLGAIPMLRRRDLAVARRKRSIVEYASRRPLSRFAESLRMLRAYLRISTDGAPSIIQVTSAVSGEGKSTVAATLAVSAASAGVRTVLIDADVRSSSVSAMFGARHAEGLTDILELGVPFRSVLRERDDMPLAVLGAGSSLLPRPDIIDSRRFATLLEDLAESYSLIVLDGPPVLPVSDALVMSKYAHSTILVVQWRATPRDVAAQAVKVLRTVNAPLVGVMLNKIDLSKVSQYEAGYPEYGQPAAKAH
jgi:capsular exopolysaccharide synthesis family protein